MVVCTLREAPSNGKLEVRRVVDGNSTPKDEVSNVKDLPAKSKLCLKKEKEYCLRALSSCLGRPSKRDARAYRKVR